MLRTFRALIHGAAWVTLVVIAFKDVHRRLQLSDLALACTNNSTIIWWLVVAVST
jgi:hypothetical protein